MAGRARGTPGPGGRELKSRGSSDQVTRRGDRREQKAAENTPAGEKPQPQQVKEAQQTKPDQSAPVQVSDAAVQIAAAHQYCHMTS